jgi:hypothetical protein
MLKQAIHNITRTRYLFVCPRQLPMCLTKHYTMKTYGGVDVYIHVFLTSVLVGDEWSASCSCSFIPGERALGNHCIGGWVVPRAGLDDVEK